MHKPNQPNALFEHENPALYPAILEALESKPHPTISASFAARTALLAQSQTVQPARATPHYGQTAAWLSLVVLMAAIVALSPATIASGSLTLTPMSALEYALIAQLLALALWLGTRTFPEPANTSSRLSL